MLTIEHQRPEHLAQVLSVNETAFDRKEEARLVESQIRKGKAPLSLVALEADRVVGHALFSRVRIFPEKTNVRAAGLGPVAVLPSHRGRGVATTLIEQGLKDCLRLDINAVFVMGDVDFYARFGFASIYTITSDFDAPEGAFMALELKTGSLAGILGKALYEPEFALTAEGTYGGE